MFVYIGKWTFIMLKEEEKAKKYFSYRETDFATDSYFLQWRLLQDKESTDFWTSYRTLHPEQEQEIRRAVSIVESIRFNEKKFSDEEKKKAISKLMLYIRARKRIRRIRFYSCSAAAAILTAAFLVVAPYFFYSESSMKESPRTYVIPQNQEIYLIAEDYRVFSIADQSQIVCEPDGKIVVDGEPKDSVNRHETAEKIPNRKLVVPPGKRMKIRLPDGTKVWVNSGTTLEFPVAFAGKQRHIQVNGEVYLEVAKNKDMPFVVSSSQFEVEVLGTKFGISAYAQMKEQSVVLVEGAVQVNTRSGCQTRLQPSQLFCLEDGMVSMKAVDPYSYIPWKDDVLYFNGETLQEVFFRLSKQYAVDIVWEKEMRSIRLYGKLVLEDHVEEVLDNIAVLSPIEYHVQNNKIIVNKK